jgi:hypothetical protein
MPNMTDCFAAHRICLELFFRNLLLKIFLANVAPKTAGKRPCPALISGSPGWAL